MNLRIGIWMVEEDGISCHHDMHRHSFITNEMINCKMITRSVIVWDFPIHFAYKIWSTEEIIKDLLLALSIKRKILNLDQSELIDINTWELVIKILKDRRIVA